MAEPGSTETVREMSQDGADITTPTAMPTGGWGIRGWLSALYTALKNAVDLATNAIIFITYPHHKIHDGDGFSAYFFNTTANADDARSVIAFKTPNTTRWGHPTIQVSASSPAEFILLEGPTLDLDEGNEEPIYNRNRNSATVSTMIPITTAGTPGEITTFLEAEINGATLVGGLEIDYKQLAGGEGPKAVGGSERDSQEWVLKQDTIYLFILQNIGASVNLHTINLNWYENTNEG